MKIAIKTAIEIELPPLSEGAAMLRSIKKILIFIGGTIAGLALTLFLSLSVIIILLIRLIAQS